MYWLSTGVVSDGPRCLCLVISEELVGLREDFGTWLAPVHPHNL